MTARPKPRGPGRPPLPVEERGVTITVRVPPSVKRSLDQSASAAGESRSAAFVRAVGLLEAAERAGR